jgi:hypothetical protein
MKIRGGCYVSSDGAPSYLPEWDASTPLRGMCYTIIMQYQISKAEAACSPCFPKAFFAGLELRLTLRRHPNLAERLSWCLTHFRLKFGLVHCKIVLVHVLPREIQELVLILPAQRLLLELFRFVWWKWWLGDLSDEIGCRGFCETVDEDAYERDLDENVEAKAKTEEYASPVLEPQLLLLLVVAHAREVRLKLLYVSLSEVW